MTRTTARVPSDAYQTPSEAGRKVVVVGAGIIGITSAIRLKESGHDVVILAQETPTTILARETTSLKSTQPATYTSSGSGGLWMPFLLEGEDVQRWASTAYKRFESEADAEVGVGVLEGFLLRARTMPEDMPWYANLTSMDVVTPQDDNRVPTQYKSALRFVAPVVQMGKYLKYLEGLLEKLNIPVKVTQDYTAVDGDTKWTAKQVAEFCMHQFEGERPVVINCCGLGAAKLAAEDMIPGRGLTVRVERPADKNYFISEDMTDGHFTDGLLAYCIPRGDEYTLGGTIFQGDWSETANTSEVEELKQRCETLLPGISNCTQTQVWSGLRPLRADGMARVEVQTEGLDGHNGIDVVANYGHGGGGVTTCWGCADEVVQIVSRFGAT